MSLWRHLFVVAVLTTGPDPDPQDGDRGLCLAIRCIYRTYTFLQAARMLLRVDDVVQATRKEKEQHGPPPEEMAE